MKKKCPETFKLIASTSITQFCKVADKFTVLKIKQKGDIITFEKRDKDLLVMVEGVIIKIPILLENEKSLIFSMIYSDDKEETIGSMILDLNKKIFKSGYLTSNGETASESGTFSIEKLNFMKKTK